MHSPADGKRAGGLEEGARPNPHLIFGWLQGNPISTPFVAAASPPQIIRELCRLRGDAAATKRIRMRHPISDNSYVRILGATGARQTP